jgi:hypothetical protein
MEIRVENTGERHVNGDPGASDVTSTYRVVDNGNELRITYRSHKYGSSLGIAGEQGVLYTDAETGMVHRHVLAVGRGCGIGVESDELVEGLSLLSIRAVIFAARTGETREIVLSDEGPDAEPGRPVVLVGGRTQGLAEEIMMKAGNYLKD